MDDHREPDEGREDLDRWLHARIDPLPPPPGTFDLIKRRVRHRRYRQVAVSAAVAAAVAAAVVVVPRVAPSVLRVNQNPPGHGVAADGSPTPSAPASRGTLGSPGPTPRASTAVPTSTAAPAPVPPNFQATSATFIGLHTGWVIGQAGTPGHCSTQYCTSVARTGDAGQTWTGVPAPKTGAPDGAAGVSQIRFLNTNDGWAFGPELFATTDGGQHWTKESTGGLRVTALETVGNRAFAILATCTGTGSDFAAQCTNFSLYSTPAGQDAWEPVSGADGLANGGQDGSASLVLTSSRGYLLAPDGTLYTGPVDGSGSWQQVSSSPAGGATCIPGQAQAGGQPSGALLAAADSADLVLACVPASGSESRVLTSGDGGGSWQQAGTVSAGTILSAAAQPGGEIVLAGTGGIQVSQDNGATWQGYEQGAAGPPGGFTWVGMTSSHQGVAVPADTSQHALWFTFTGGQAWQRWAISEP